MIEEVLKKFGDREIILKNKKWSNGANTWRVSDYSFDEDGQVFHEAETLEEALTNLLEKDANR